MKKTAASKTQNNKVDMASLGQTFYSILEVNRDKIVDKIISSSSDLNIERETLQKISDIINSETEVTKNWGFDSLIRILK